MKTIKSIYYYVYIACLLMAVYCFFQAAPDNATWNELTKYGFLQLLFSVGAVASYTIYKSDV